MLGLIDCCWEVENREGEKIGHIEIQPSPAQPSPAQVAEVSEFNEPIRLLRPCPTQEYCSIRKPLKHGNNGGRAAVTLGVQVLHLRRNVTVGK